MKLLETIHEIQYDVRGFTCECGKRNDFAQERYTRLHEVMIFNYVCSLVWKIKEGEGEV